MGRMLKVDKEINVRLPRGKRLLLSARARYVWGRLVRLPFPTSAAKLAKWCGQLVGRSDGLAAALAELAELRLVERGPRGWAALEPTGEVRDLFEWPKRLAHLSRWQDRYGYTSVTVPVTYPFAGLKITKTVKGQEKRIVIPENALEVWLVWETLRGKTRDEFPGPSLLAYRLGITRQTARKITRDIAAIPRVFSEDGELACLGGERQSHTVCTDPVERVLDEVCVPVVSRQSLRDKSDELKLTNTQFIRLVKKAVGRHNAAEFGDDPTAMIRTFLKAQAGFKVKGRGTTLRQSAGV